MLTTISGDRIMEGEGQQLVSLT